MRYLIVVALVAGMVVVGCKSSPKTAQTGGDTSTGMTGTEMQGMQTDMTQGGGDTVTTSSGLKYIVLKEGEGASPQQGQTPQVHYTVWLTNGRKIQSSRDTGQPFEFVLGQGRVIKGWEEGVALMKVGDTRKFIIPPELAWGDRGFGGQIPPGSTVIFEVELLGIK